MIDQTDREILRLLQENSRRQWKDIGQRVHLTGQAVAARIHRLEDLGVIEGFSVKVNHQKTGRPLMAFITVYMKTAGHQAFEHYLAEREIVAVAHRISGEGCYLLEANVAAPEELNGLLDEILEHGNYRVSLSIGKIK
ncbi:MAG: Lrp/AsnC family transcriptional regulator [Desulfocucumaceae bacterium]